MSNKIKLIMLGCIPRGTRGRRCKVSVVNAGTRWQANKIINKCRETHRNVGGSCTPIITYNAETKVPINL